MHAQESGEVKDDQTSSSMTSKISKDFDEALEDDMNTHLATSALFQLVKETNKMAAEEKLGNKQCSYDNDRI